MLQDISPIALYVIERVLARIRGCVVFERDRGFAALQ